MADDKLKPVSSADIKEVLQTAGLGRYETLMKVVSAWDEVAGPQILSHTKLREITPEGVLVVDVDDSTWFTELRMLSGELLKKLNEQLKGVRVRRIKFQLRAKGR